MRKNEEKKGMEKDMNLREKQNENCPGCGRHCPADALHCGRGREYFGIQIPEGENGHHRRMPVKDNPDAPLSEQVLGAMRGCGHFLHHSVGHGNSADSEALLAVLSEEEKKQLLAMLKKCLNSWDM